MSDIDKSTEELIQELTQLREDAAYHRRMLQLIVDGLPQRIFWKDLNSAYLGTNRLFAQDAGRASPSEMLAKTDYEMPWAEQAEAYRGDDAAVMASGEPKYHIVEPQDRPDGSKAWLDTNKVPLRDESGKVFGILGTYEDITDRKQAEQALEDQRTALAQTVAARTEELKQEIANRAAMQEEQQRLQQEIIEAQKRAIAELSTPIIPVTDRIIVIPLIGSIDSLRAKEVMRSVLAGISQYRARVVIIDVTGVPVVDSGVASHLSKAFQAARLKGARTYITGISDAVAEAIVDLGIDWSGLVTLSDLQTGLVAALRSQGIRWVKAHDDEDGVPG